MRRELHYFDIYPKVVPVGEPTVLTVKYLERRYRPKDGEKITVRIIPMTESMENMGADYDCLETSAENGGLSFSYCFGKEQEYGIIIYINKNKNEFIRMPVYALEPDLYARLPLKGDFHVHSNYSDGWESPELVAACYRKAGYDFMTLTDHGTMQGSIDAISFYQGLGEDQGFPMGLNIIRGEEVHAPGNHVHIVNFGGAFSVNDIYRNEQTRYYQEVKVIEEGLDPSYVFSNDRERFEYASCLWVYEQIRKGQGLAIYAHPHWIVEAYNVRDTMSLLQFKNKAFDAFELVGGLSPQENNMQLALYYTACKNGYGDFPIVGSSDSHGAIREPFFGSTYANWSNNPYGFDELQTIVFATSNDKDNIIDAVKQGYSVAVERYKGETPRVHGDYRLVSYALFLISEYFPLHDELCHEEGRLMTVMISSDKEKAGQALVKRAAITEESLRKYFAM